MKPSSVLRQRLIASLLVCALMVPSVALAKSKNTDNQPRHKTTAIVLTAAGIGLAALGAWGLSAPQSGFGSVSRTPVRAVGGVCVGAGIGMTVGGILLLTRRPKPPADAGAGATLPGGR